MATSTPTNGPAESSPILHDALAQAAVRAIESGMVVALGTGRAATRGVRALAQRVKDGGLTGIACVATSRATAELAGSLGLTVRPLGEVDRADYLFDGADEVGPGLVMIKGGGGAMTREKIAARLADRRVYLIQQSKHVGRLGATHPLPIEVLDEAEALVGRLLRERGLGFRRRVGASGEPVLTDGGNPIVDATLGEREGSEASARALGAWLDGVPGVVGHGLFLDEADEVWIEGAGADLARLVR